MKAQYKIDQFVKFKNETTLNEDTGIIEAVLTTKTEYSYRMVDSESFIEERNIIQAYRPVVQRKTTRAKNQKTGVRATKKNTNSEQRIDA